MLLVSNIAVHRGRPLTHTIVDYDAPIVVHGQYHYTARVGRCARVADHETREAVRHNIEPRFVTPHLWNARLPSSAMPGPYYDTTRPIAFTSIPQGSRVANAPPVPYYGFGGTPNITYTSRPVTQNTSYELANRLYAPQQPM